ncbi:hypothetical protein FBU30_000141 [Linnemannia zychae]|nr:hypothetical protein FBU30_000141 [Linnemannia zychae]
MTYMFSFSHAARKKPVSVALTTVPDKKQNSIVALPLHLPEILYIIFSFLNQHTLCNSVRLVCKQWLTISRPFIQYSLLWKDRTSTEYKHRYILRRLHRATILRVLFEQSWQLQNTQFAWRELGETIDSLRDKGQLKIRTLELKGGNFLESRLYPILPRITTLTYLRIERMVQQVIHVGVILAVAPHLKKLFIEGIWSQSHTIEFDTTPSWTKPTLQDAAAAKSDLVNLTIKWMSIDQHSLEAILSRCPRIVTLKLIELRRTPSQLEPFDRPRLLTLISSLCPLTSWFHLSFEGQGMSKDESTIFKEIIELQPEQDMAISRKKQQVMSILSNDIRPETQLQLFKTQTIHVNTITTLEICLGSGLSLSRYVSNTLHDFLCSSPWLQHLIAPMIPYYAEYFDLVGPIDPISGSYHPRQCRLGKHPMDLFRTRKRVWACRGLKTLRIHIDSMELDHASEENARIMFGYLAKVCPDLHELSIRRRQLNLNLAGGLCLLTRLKKLERLMVWTDTWTKLSKKDLEWMARIPKKKSMEKWVIGLSGGSKSYKRTDRHFQGDFNEKSRPGTVVRTLSSASTSSSSSIDSQLDTRESDAALPLTIDDMGIVGTMADIEAWEKEQKKIKKHNSSGRGIRRLSQGRIKEQPLYKENDEGICWPKLDFLGLQLVMVHKDQPLKLEEHLPAMIAKIRPETEFSCEANQWHEFK